jgi:hypothetical protein
MYVRVKEYYGAHSKMYGRTFYYGAIHFTMGPGETHTFYYAHTFTVQSLGAKGPSRGRGGGARSRFLRAYVAYTRAPSVRQNTVAKISPLHHVKAHLHRRT